MKNRDDKRKDFEDLKKKIGENPNIFVTGFEKLTVSQDYELRKLIRQAGGEYKVIKNNVAQKAADGTPAQPLMADLKGMTSVAYTAGDPVALAKALTNTLRKIPIHLQSGDGGRARGRPQYDQRTGQHAAEGAGLCKAAVPDQCIGPAAGDSDQRRGAKPGRGGRSGREGKQVSAVILLNGLRQCLAGAPPSNR